METENKNVIKIPIPNTNFFVWGEKQTRNTWNLFLIDPPTNYKVLIKENMSTKAFVVLSNMTLKTPFPYVDE